MSELPLVTIITPSYRSTGTIKETVDSVLKQSYPAVQFIVIDDGTEGFVADDLISYIDENKKSNLVDFTVIGNEKNLGTVKTLNRGLSLTKGKYVYTLAADDCFYDDDVLLDWTNEFIRINADTITTKRAVYDENMLKQKYVAPIPKQIELIEKSAPKELFESMTGYNFIFGCCTAHSKSCLDRYGGFDERYRLIEDYPLNLKLLRNGEKIRFFDRITIKYRLGGVSNANKITKSYATESDSIFKNEVLPLTADKRNAKKSYKLWKRRSSYLSEKAVYREKYKPDFSRCGRIKYRFVMLVRHLPYAIEIEKTKLKVKRKQNKKDDKNA